MSEIDDYARTHFSPWTISALKTNGPHGVTSLDELAAIIRERKHDMYKWRKYGPKVIAELVAWAESR